MKEGEVNILGGILEEQPDQKRCLGSRGWLPFRCSGTCSRREDKELHDNEIVFILIPHIVRAQDVNASNMRAIDVGTANSIVLRKTTLSRLTTAMASRKAATATVRAMVRER